MVNICVNSKDKYPELKEFLERIKIYAEDLKGMKREIIMPINNDDYLRDVVLENKLLGMLFHNRFVVKFIAFLYFGQKFTNLANVKKNICCNFYSKENLRSENFRISNSASV